MNNLRLFLYLVRMRRGSTGLLDSAKWAITVVWPGTWLARKLKP